MRKPYERQMDPIDTKNLALAFHQESKKLTTEASQFPGRQIRLEQIYDDACDQGICLRSHRTGEEKRFLYVESVIDREGDLMYLKFKPLDFIPGVDELLIFND